jgi:hypothetical protein
MQLWAGRKERGTIMVYRSLAVVLVLFAVVCLVGQFAIADDKNANSHEGKIVRAGNGSLTMTDKDGQNQQTFKVAANARISCDDKECKLDDLKPGYHVKVTQGSEADKAVIRIEAHSKAK